MIENVLSAKRHSKAIIPAVDAPEEVKTEKTEQKPSFLEKHGVLAYYINNKIAEYNAKVQDIHREIVVSDKR